MSGLDAVDRELLGMADEDDSSEEEQVVNKEAANETPAGHTDSDDDDAAIATAPTPKRRRIGRKKRNASEDEGEASEDAAADEDDADSAPLQGPAGGVLYGFEGIYESAREKALIEQMPELEREEILAKRREEIDNRRLEQQLLQRRAADTKRKSVVEDDEENQKKRKLPGGKNAALDKYKAERATKSQRQTLKVDDTRKDRDPSEDVSRGEESDVEWDTGKDRADSQYDEPATHTDLYRAQAKRTLMANHAFQAGFNRAITGCYVRIAGAPLPGSKQPTYRVARVDSVRDSDDPDQHYLVTDSKGAKFKLGKMVTVSIGKKKQEFPTSNCSDTKISLNEYEEYKAALEKEGLPLPKKSVLLKKNRDLLEMESHQMTQQEVEERLQKTGIAGRKQKEIKIQILRRELVSARANQDVNAVDRLETELRELGVKAMASPTTQREPDDRKNEQEKLAVLNRKARKENAENVKRAQLNEARRKDKLRAEMKAKAAKAHDGVEETNGVNGHTSQTLESLLNGEHDDDEAEPGKVDFRKYDAVWQFGTLSKNRMGKKSVFKRTFFRSEMIAALGIKIDTSGLGMDLD